MEKGKYVTRSVYQKVCEENKRLLSDIKLLAGENSADSILVKAKWSVVFKREEQFNVMMKQAAKSYLAKHPEFDITSPKFKKP